MSKRRSAHKAPAKRAKPRRPASTVKPSLSANPSNARTERSSKSSSRRGRRLLKVATVPAPRARREHRHHRARASEAAIGITRTGLDGRLLEVNQKVFDMLGYSSEELLGLSLVDITHPDDRAPSNDLRDRLLTDPDERSWRTRENRYLRKDGSIASVSISVSLVRNERSEPDYFVAIVQDVSDRKEAEVIEDISERKRAELDLKKQNALRVLLESLAVAANQAATSEQALRACLSRICSYGGWPIGHVVMFGDPAYSIDKRTSTWHLSEPERWDEFKRISDPLELRTDGHGLVSGVIASRRPVWSKDIGELGLFGRGGVARRLGLKSAFAFPVVARQRVVAYLEFFSDQVVEPDEALLDVTTNIGAQLGRVIERGFAETALRKSEQRFRDIVDQAGIGITQVDLDGRCVLVNDQYCQITGYTRDEMLTMSVHDIISPPDAEKAQLLSAQLLSGEIDTLRADLRIRHKNGAYVWVSVSTSVLREAGGAPKLFISAIEDISERKRTEAALHESEEQFHQLAGNIPQMCWITSVHQRDVLYLSPAFEHITGYSIEAAKARSKVLVAMVHPEDRRRVQTARKNAAVGGYDETFRLVRPDDKSVRWVRDRAFPIRDANGEVFRIAGIAEDITERKQAEERMQHLAHHDALTDLPNRVLFQDRLKQALVQARRNRWNLGVLFIDLDGFKIVNDTLGHVLGDKLLQLASGRLTDCVRSGDTVSRFGGDEFALILRELISGQNASMVAQKILDAFAPPFDLDGNETYVTASIGITLYPADSESITALMKNADTAMYSAKAAGRNNYQFYTAEMNRSARKKMQLEAGLRRALERQEFVLHYQPKVDVMSGQITGLEALIRWQSPESGLVPPAQFLPVLEETGLIVPVGAWVVRAACRQISQWQRSGVQPVSVAINISGRQFQQPELVKLIADTLAEFNVEPHWLEIEITESSLMQKPESATAVLHHLKALGIRISIDDFGTGYSSLGYLKRFPLNALKIDGSFVRDITVDADAAAITRAVLTMAHSLDLKVIAEGVETEEQLAFLRAHRCDEAQGNLFAKPLVAADCTTLLSSNRRLHEGARNKGPLAQPT